ncbi:hypothetical protein DMH04_55020 [Kibdelosporangium aridum]|uniref:PLAT domain-containing protein n=1 Tax=Kibdelosporangium aridum TaxID=2030 RepID=A0A428XX43_KIBAR|nr:hypothetical protein DMH04_55020 [Kibdelosporangium aridum]
MLRKHRLVILGLLCALLVGGIISQAIAAEAASQVEYVIFIKTSDVDDAGTDSDLRMSLCGTKGCTGWEYVDDPSRDDREQGRTDQHVRRWTDVGTLTQVKIYQEWNGSWWRLNSIRVDYNGKKASFGYDRWVDRGTWIHIDADR